MATLAVAVRGLAWLVVLSYIVSERLYAALPSLPVIFRGLEDGAVGRGSYHVGISPKSIFSSSVVLVDDGI